MVEEDVKVLHIHRVLKHKETLLSGEDVVEVLLTLEGFEDYMRVLILGGGEEDQLEMLLQRSQHLSKIGPEFDVDLKCLFKG